MKNGKLMFEGEYLNEKKKGKDNNIKDKLKFEGEKNEKGKAYHIDSKLKFKEEYLKGKKIERKRRKKFFLS